LADVKGELHAIRKSGIGISDDQIREREKNLGRMEGKFQRGVNRRGSVGDSDEIPDEISTTLRREA